MYFLNQNVKTPYGEGIYLGLSEDPEILKVQPTGWTMARDTKPTFFLNSKDVKPAYTVGCHVFMTYGEGTITAFREGDSMYIVELLNWKLAQGQSPSLYLQESALSRFPVIVASSAPAELEAPEPPKLSYAESCIANAIASKEEAGTFYKKADYQTAKDKYLKALEAMQYLGESLTNEQKAIVFEQTVPCHNNISLCCMQLKNYTESALFAKNGIMLISALEERIEEGQVWQQLLERGMTKNKLVKEWKIKSYFLAGKSELLKKDYETSIALLEAGLKILDNDPLALAEITKLKDLHVSATKKRSAELKKEKSTWAKAFQKNKEEPEVIPVTSMEGSKVVEDVNSIEEILKSMNAPTSAATNTSPSKSAPPPASTSKKAEPKKVKKTLKIVEPVSEEEIVECNENVTEGNDDSVSDETFGWLVGATTILSVVGIVAFFLLKSKQR